MGTRLDGIGWSVRVAVGVQNARFQIGRDRRGWAWDRRRFVVEQPGEALDRASVIGDGTSSPLSMSIAACISWSRRLAWVFDPATSRFIHS